MNKATEQMMRWIVIVASLGLAVWMLVSKLVFVYADGGMGLRYGLIAMGYQLLFALPLFCIASLCWARRYAGLATLASAILAVVVGAMVQSVLLAFRFPDMWTDRFDPPLAAIGVWPIRLLVLVGPFALAIWVFRVLRRRGRQFFATSNPAPGPGCE